MASSSRSTASAALKLDRSRLRGCRCQARRRGLRRSRRGARAISNLANASSRAAAVHDLAGLGAGHRALEPGGDRILAGAGFAQLGLQLGDVGLIAAQHLLDLARSRRAGPRPCRPPSGARSAPPWRGPRGPCVSASSALAVQLAWRSSSRSHARRISLTSAIERAADGANLDQSLFHLEDDHPDHPRRVLGPVEQLGHVRREDIASAAEHGTAEPGGERARAAAVGGLWPDLDQPRRARPEPWLRGLRVQALRETSMGLALAWAGPTAALTATVLVSERRGDGDQGAGELGLRRHFQSPFFGPLSLCCGPMPIPNSRARANPGKLRKIVLGMAAIGRFHQPSSWWISPMLALGTFASRGASMPGSDLRKGVRAMFGKLAGAWLGSKVGGPQQRARRARCSVLARRRSRGAASRRWRRCALGGWAFNKWRERRARRVAGLSFGRRLRRRRPRPERRRSK